MIVVERGSTQWVALVEVKTGRNTLDADQVDRYLQIANGLGFDAMLTISHEIVADPSESPIRVDTRRTRKVRLAHLSWSRIMTEAVVEAEHRGVDDPEQSWILSELIAYMDNEKSGAGGYEGMVPNGYPSATRRVRGPFELPIVGSRPSLRTGKSSLNTWH